LSLAWAFEDIVPIGSLNTACLADMAAIVTIAIKNVVEKAEVEAATA
jgi:hypothetical protein